MNACHSSGKWAGRVWGGAARGLAAALPVLLLLIVGMGGVVTPSTSAHAATINCTGGPFSPNNDGGGSSNATFDFAAQTCVIGANVTPASTGSMRMQFNTVETPDAARGHFRRADANEEVTASNFETCSMPGGVNNGSQCTRVADPLTSGNYVIANNAAGVLVTLTTNVTVTGVGNMTINSASVDIPGPEINVTGNGISILSGDATWQVADGTDFGSANVDGGQVTHDFIIQNTGGQTLNLGAITITHTDHWSLTANPSNTGIAPGGTATLSVRFDPSFEIDTRPLIAINSDDADEATYTFNLRGVGINGTPDLGLEGNGQEIAFQDATPSVADHTDFGTVALTGAQLARTFTLVNQGTASTSLSGTPIVAITGAHAADFVVTTQPAQTFVNPLIEPTFVVTFDPSAPGLRTATVSIPNNVAGENPFTFAIQGTGGGPEINVTGNGQAITHTDATPSAADHTDFGNQDVSAGALSRTFTVENTGGNTLTLGANAVSLGGADAALFAVTAQPATSVAASGSTTFTVAFDPLIAGAANATLSIANDDADESPYTFAITGTGTSGTPEIAVTGNGQDIAHTDVTPDAADHTVFGAVLVPAGTVVRTFTIQNSGSSTLNLGANAVSIAGAHAADFSVTTQPATQLAAAGNEQFSITFDPSAIGVRTATISIANDDGDESPFTFAISGTGQAVVPEIAVRGNAVEIVTGDVTPASADLTDFGARDVTTGTIARSFTIANTGTGTLTLGANAVSLAGANAADFAVTTQPAVNIAAAATTSFTLTFDPSAGGTRVATVTINNNDADESPYTFAIQGTGQVGGTITLVQTVTGPDVTTEFASTTAALNTTLTSSGGSGTLTLTAIPVGAHTVTAANLAALGYGITSISCNDTNSSGDVANASATIVLAGGETVSCTFVVVESRAATSRMIADFLGARGTFLLSNQPGSGRRTRRFSGNSGGSGTSGSLSAFGLSGRVPVPLQAVFSGDTLSFSSAHGWGQAASRALPNPARRLGANDNEAEAPRPVLGLDRSTVWIEGTIAGFDDRQSDGTFGVVYVGADQLVTPDILVGGLVQYDWFKQEQDTGGGKVTGRGWMAGPYATFRLDDSLFADVRFAWGKSRNDVTPIGTYTDTFDTTRWLATGAFIGDFTYENWSIHPTVSLAYLRETQKRYTDSLGIDIPGQSVSQGELKAGPRIGYAHLFESGDQLEPYIGLEGAYVFGDDGLYSDGSLAKEVSGLRGRAGYGLEWRNPAGQSLSLSGTYDGIGTNVGIVGVSLKLSIPLN